MDQDSAQPMPTIPETPRKVKPIVEEITPTDLETPVDPGSAPSTVATPVTSPPTPPTEIGQPDVSFPPPPGKSPSMLPWIIALIAFLAVALAGGVYVYMTGVGNSEVIVSPTPIATLEPEVTSSPEATSSANPSASPSAEIDLSKYKVSILNGTGKIGEANKAKALLEKEGFKVTSTGNAASFDIEETTIEAKPTVPAEVIDAASDALKSTYTVISGDALKSTNTYDLVITLGSK